MKKLKFLILSMSLLVLLSCKNDDNSDNNVTANHFTYNGTTYQLKSAGIENYGEVEAGIYNFDIILITSDLTFIGGQPIPVENIISGLYFELFTSSAQDIAIGQYDYLAFDGSYESNTFDYAEITIDYNISTDEGEYYEINSGFFKVLSNGSTYELEFEGTTAAGGAFSGYYKGSLYEIDDTNRMSTQSSIKKTKNTLLNP